MPAPPPSRLEFDGADHDRLTHRVFRYPAKFHPPVVRALLDAYAADGDHVLDPFCGSGTVLVEANARGLDATGSDIDPLAVFVSHVKTAHYDPDALARSCETVTALLAADERPPDEYERLMFEDLSVEDVAAAREAEGLWLPAIPNLWHWFRKYAALDLARILRRIQAAPVEEPHRDFLRIVFAAAIRNSSNADPVPVSGLEVTSHMKEKDRKGRLVNPYAVFRKALKKGLAGVRSLAARGHNGVSRVVQADTTRLSTVEAVAERGPYRLVVTSPPYNSAVDYYRRHQLEMFWLGLVQSQADRLQLKHKYVGRDKITNGEAARNDEADLGPTALRWERAMTDQDEVRRARDFRHYILSMRQSFREIAAVTAPGGTALCVVGHSRWKGKELPTKTLLAETAAPEFDLDAELWYPIKNRYMSYDRHNGADISREYVLVLKKP